MQTVKLAILVTTLLASVAMATTADVTWTPRGYASNYDGSVMYSLNAIPATGDRWLTWTHSVRVAGDNLGLAGYVLDMGIRDLGTGTWAPHPFNYDASDGSRWWIPAYKSIKKAGGTIADDGGNGGPGLSTLPKLGTQSWNGAISQPYNIAYLDQFGASLLDFTPFLQTQTGYTGAQTWGVGLDSRKDVLLADPNGTYDAAAGYIDLTGWAPGTYRVELFIWASSVLRSGLSLNSGGSQYGVLWPVPTANLHGESFTFTIVPEPATLLLLAGVGLLHRRRRP